MKPRILFEDERQAYLDAMGIQSYFPRQPLANAAPSRQYRLKKSSSTSSMLASCPASGAGIRNEMTPSTPGVQVLSPGSRRGERQITAKRPPEPRGGLKPGAESKPEPQPLKPEPAPIESAPAPPFSFVCVPASAELLVINELPPGGHFSEEHRNLLSRILKALSVDSPPAAMRPRPFHWPLPGALHTDETSARDAVRGFIGSHLRAREQGSVSTVRVRYLLVMADNCLDFIFPSGALDGTEAGCFLDYPGTAVQAVNTLSLDAMIRRKELKKQVWQHLQGLRGALQNLPSEPS